MEKVRPIKGPSITLNKKDVKRAIKAFGLKGTIKRYSEYLNEDYAKKIVKYLTKS